MNLTRNQAITLTILAVLMNVGLAFALGYGAGSIAAALGASPAVTIITGWLVGVAVGVGRPVRLTITLRDE